MEKLAVVIYRNNLRIDDNYPLYFATKENKKVLAIYSLEILKGFTSYGFKKVEKFRRKFIYESLNDLDKSLNILGINLLICEDIKSTLKELSNGYNLKIYFDEEVGYDEENFENILKEYNHKSFFNQTLIEPFYFDYNKSFSHFRKKAEKQKINMPLKINKKVLSINCISKKLIVEEIKYTNNYAIKLKGGESQALKRFDEYEEFIHSYKATRNEMSGLNNSTKFSAYLSTGCISPRRLYFLIKKYEKETFLSESSYWIYFELLWRDFFHLVMKYSRNKLFLKKGLSKINYNFIENKNILDNFFNGKTNTNLIDASIKELKSTGWLSNRNRQLVANYFVKYLGLNWIYGAQFFESYLIDYNPASNYGNWSYQAYVGNDKQYRVFDLEKQIKMYDGIPYIKQWHKLQNNNTNYKLNIKRVKEDVFLIKD